MARQRFVLRFAGDGAKPAHDLERIRNLPEANVLDESSARMILLETHEQPLRELVETLPGWIVSPEQAVPLPDTRKRIRHAR